MVVHCRNESFIDTSLLRTRAQRDAKVEDLRRQVQQLKRRLARYEALEHDDSCHDSMLQSSYPEEKNSLFNHTCDIVLSEKASYRFHPRLNLTFQRVFDEEVSESLTWPFSSSTCENEDFVDWKKTPIYDEEFEESLDVLEVNCMEADMSTFEDCSLDESERAQAFLGESRYIITYKSLEANVDDFLGIYQDHSEDFAIFSVSDFSFKYDFLFVPANEDTFRVFPVNAWWDTGWIKINFCYKMFSIRIVGIRHQLSPICEIDYGAHNQQVFLIYQVNGQIILCWEYDEQFSDWSLYYWSRSKPQTYFQVITMMS